MVQFPTLVPEYPVLLSGGSLLPITHVFFLDIFYSQTSKKDKYFLLIIWIHIKHLECAKHFCCINFMR